MSTADLVVCMTQDAMPADETLIEELVKPFDDPEVWAAYARQLPNEDCREVEKYTRSFNYPEQSLSLIHIFYSKNFNISLAVMSLITAAIILAMQSNLVISLGMVGALSIVRFRTAIKDPMDLAFLFWSISIGIICGAGLYEIALVTSVGVTVFILVLDMLPVGKAPICLLYTSRCV